MLNCTVVNGHSVLFYDGDVRCLQVWQYGVMASVCVFVLPFFAVLLLVPRLLQSGRISSSAFLLAFVFPLFALGPVVYLFVVEFRNEKREFSNSETDRSRRDLRNPAEDGDQLDDSSDESRQLLVDVVFGPYETVRTVEEHNYRTRKPYLYGLCWEGFINLRRLIAVVLAVYVNDPLAKHICLTLACFTFLLLHLRVKPFKHAFSNYAESVALVLLLNVAAMNLVKAAFYNSQSVPRDVGYLVIVAFEWVETATLVVLPACIVALLVVSMVLRTSRRAVRRSAGDAAGVTASGQVAIAASGHGTATTIVGEFRDLSGGKDSQRRMIRHLAAGERGSLGGRGLGGGIGGVGGGGGGSASDLLRAYEPNLPRSTFRSPWLPYDNTSGSETTPTDTPPRTPFRTPVHTPLETRRAKNRRYYPQPNSQPSAAYSKENEPSHLLRY